MDIDELRRTADAFDRLGNERDALRARVAELEALLAGIKGCTRRPNPTDQSMVHVAPGKVKEFSRLIDSIE